MNTTIFLAQIWGPILLAVGLGIFTSQKYYTKIYRDLEKDSLAVLIFGMFAMAIGIVQIGVHNVWNNLPEVLISIFGWGTLIKGILFLVAPDFVDKGGNWWAKTKLIPVAGVLMLVVGIYLSWFGYFS